MFKSKGILYFNPTNVTKKHLKQSSWKSVAVMKIDDDLPEYYSWFLKNRFNLQLNKPLRGSHVTVINDVIDSSIYEQSRSIFHKKEISIEYDPTFIRCNDKGHWWIKVYSNDIDNIRSAMGLGKPYFGLHLTLGRATHLQLEHSNYIRKVIMRHNI
jgi:hypothetical protein